MTRRGELTLRASELDAARQVAAPAAREVPRARGRRDPLPPPRARPDRERGDARAVHPALEGDRRDPPLARRARLPRGRDAGAPAALRRRAGAAVHDPLQRPRPRLLPAHRHRALPEAADRRRARAGLRDRQELPQRGPLAQAQPRVHDARVVRGLRRLRATWRSELEELVAYVAGEVGYDGRARLLAPVEAGDACATRSATRPGSTCSSTATATRCSRPRTRAASSSTATRPGRSSWTTCSPSTSSRSSSSRPSSSTTRWSCRRSPRHHRSEAGARRALRVLRRGMEFANAFTELNDPDEQRARFEEQRRQTGRGRRGGAALRRGLRARPGARHAAHRRASASASTGS